MPVETRWAKHRTLQKKIYIFSIEPYRKLKRCLIRCLAYDTFVRLVFRSAPALQRHINTDHENSSLHQCELCPFIAKTKTQLKHHMFEHNRGMNSVFITVIYLAQVTPRSLLGRVGFMTVINLFMSAGCHKPGFLCL